VIIDQALYRGGRRQPCGDISDELAQLRVDGSDGDFLWIGLKNPTTEEFDAINAELGLHELAVEDAVKGKQRVKIEQYDDVLVVVVKPLRYIEETSDIETGDLMVFVGNRFLLTVRRGEASPLAGIRGRLEKDVERMALGPMAALHAILDSIVDNYQAIDFEVSNDLEQIETEVFSGAEVDSTKIYRLKREVLEFRRATVPLAPALLQLAPSPRSPLQDPELQLLFRDVNDHLHAVLDHIDTYDRLLSDILSAHLAQVSVQQNEDMRKISAWVAMAAVPTMVAGIYGMNFDNMPELHGKYSYFIVLAGMLTIVVSLYLIFTRHGWLGRPLRERITQARIRSLRSTPQPAPRSGRDRGEPGSR
jgi:magnesium transporter